MNPLLYYWLLRSQMGMIVVLMSYWLYLAVSTEVVDSALNQIERVSTWPVQALNIALFVVVLGVCWLYLQSTRKDLQKLQEVNSDERREYIESLKTLVNDAAKIIERNNSIFERIDRRLERTDQGADRKS